MKKLIAFTRTLQFRILMITALCWILPTLLLGGYLGGGVIFASLREQTESGLLTSAAHAEATTTAELDRIITLAKSVTYDGTLAEYQQQYEAGIYKYQDTFRYLRIYMDRKFSREQAFSFAAYYPINEPGQIIATTPATQSNDLVVQFQKSAQARALQLGETLDTKCHFLSVEGQTYLIRNLLNRKLERFGMLVIGIRPEVVLRPLFDGNELWKDSILIQLDSYSSQPYGLLMAMGRFRPGLHDGRDELLVDGLVSTRDYTLAYEARVDKHVAYAQIDQFYRLMLLLLLLLLPVEALILVFVQRRLTRPLRSLAAASSRIENGELGVTVPVAGVDEVGQLSRCYNGMSLQIQRLIEKSFEEELTLRDARIEALQSRINPHFLNNTLEMINWQARIEGSDAISGMIEAMSTLINASLDRESRRVVPLREELSVADAYFYFLDQRFSDKLVVERQIDQSLLSAMVPRLALETMLENAVDHGIAPAGGGKITLRAQAERDLLVIDVINTGRRMSPEDQQRVQQLLSEDGPGVEHKLSERLGIRNIDRRAKLLYGARARLQLMPDENGDTLCRLILPMEPA